MDDFPDLDDVFSDINGQVDLDDTNNVPDDVICDVLDGIPGNVNFSLAFNLGINDIMTLFVDGCDALCDVKTSPTIEDPFTWVPL